MPRIVLCFFTGILTAHNGIHSPLIYLAVIAFSCIILASIKLRYLKLVVAFGLGYLWPFLYLQLFIPKPLSVSEENKPVIIRGYIAGIVVKKESTRTFNVHVVSMNNRDLHLAVHLNWRGGYQHLRVGEKWQLLVKLKRPHALMNPGSFDVERQYFMQHLQASGIVLPSHCNQRLALPGHHYFIQQCRESIVQLVPDAIKQNTFYGIILALTVGLTDNITKEQWDVFRATGTNHLVAISGLHIGLVSWLVGHLVRLIWHKVPNGALFISTQRLQMLGGTLGALIYGVLAGLSPSTQRALIMILATTVSRLHWRHLSTYHVLILALGVVNIIDPFVALSMGFWLSFTAVSLLVYGMNARVGVGGTWWQWVRPQWLVGLGMAPILLTYFQQVSLLSVPANLIAIPTVSFLIVPICLVGMLFLSVLPGVATLLLTVALYLLRVLWWFLTKLSGYSTLVLKSSFYTQCQEITLHLVTYLTLLPEGLLHRLMILLCWIPCCMHQPIPIPKQSMQLVVFDVGQGLAVLVRTAAHNLLYDTGNKMGSSDMGSQVLLPYLKRVGVRRIDVMTISHGDQDHIGGANTVLSHLPVTTIITSVPERFQGPVSRCEDHKRWHWDGVDFRFLSPPKGVTLQGNDGSCVLKITNGRQSILLTGDIESGAERLLLQRHRDQLRSQVLVVPHHGSKTSSTLAFLQAVDPKYAIVSCGYLNSYRHPHAEVLARYQGHHTTVLSTVMSGAITMTLPADSDIVTVQEYRLKNNKIWHQKLKNW